jgi:hypothetical protein
MRPNWKLSTGASVFAAIGLIMGVMVTPGAASTAVSTTTTTTQPSSCISGWRQPCMATPAGYSASQMVLDEKFKGPHFDADWSNVDGGPVPMGQWGDCCGTPFVDHGLMVTNTITPQSNADTSDPAAGQVLFHFPTAFYLQVRFRVTTVAQGFWPAIWFPYDHWATTSNEPVNGNEIDLYEGGIDRCAPIPINNCVEFNYGGSVNQPGGFDQGFYNVGYNISRNFVTMGVEVVPGQHAKFYVNGALALDDENGSVIGSNPNYNLLINPQLSPGTTTWHTNCPTGANPCGAGSIKVAEVQVYSAP